MNKAWKREVGNSLEWAALEIVKVDTPGLIRYLRKTGERRPSLRDRVESELDSLAVLLCERLPSFASSPTVTTLDGVGVELSEIGDEGSRIGFSSREDTDGVIGSRGCVCGWIDYKGFEEFQGRNRRENGWSEEEEIEAYASSSESSMRTYYPRHSARFRLG